MDFIEKPDKRLIVFEVEKESDLIDKFDKIWQDLGYPSRSFYIKKMMKKVIEYNERSVR